MVYQIDQHDNCMSCTCIVIYLCSVTYTCIEFLQARNMLIKNLYLLLLNTLVLYLSPILVIMHFLVERAVKYEIF